MCDGQKFSPKHIEPGGEKKLRSYVNLINQMLKLVKFFFWILPQVVQLRYESTSSKGDERELSLKRESPDLRSDL